MRGAVLDIREKFVSFCGTGSGAYGVRSFLAVCADGSVWETSVVFLDGLCETLDNMINGRVDLQENFDKELIFDRISHRLFRLYAILLEAEHKVDSERREL